MKHEGLRGHLLEPEDYRRLAESINFLLQGAVPPRVILPEDVQDVLDATGFTEQEILDLQTYGREGGKITYDSALYTSKDAYLKSIMERIALVMEQLGI